MEPGDSRLESLAAWSLDSTGSNGDEAESIERTRGRQRGPRKMRDRYRTAYTANGECHRIVLARRPIASPLRYYRKGDATTPIGLLRRI